MKFEKAALSDLETIRDKGTRGQKDYVLTALAFIVKTISLQEALKLSERSQQSGARSSKFQDEKVP